MIGDESVKALEELHRLRTAGVITDADFEASKQRILFGSKPARPAQASPRPGSASDGGLSAQELFAWATLPFKRYAEFTGRSSRREFWLFLALVNVVGAALFLFVRADTDSYGDIGTNGNGALALLVLWYLACSVPAVAAQVRRLHDQGRTGWIALINLLPYVGAFVALVLMALPGDEGDNRFGPPNGGP